MEQYIKKSAVVAEIESLERTTFTNFDEGVNAAVQTILGFINTLEVKEVDTLISDSRKANCAKFIKELKQKIDSYERELSKSGDTTKCDDVDWVVLCGDMFDMLQKCLINY